MVSHKCSHRVASEVRVTHVMVPMSGTADRSPSPRPVEELAEGISPARSHPQGTEKDRADQSQAVTYPSGFGVPHASLPEDSPEVALPKADYLPESELKEPMDVSPKVVVSTYQPPTPVEPPRDQVAWLETEGNSLDTPSWRPLKEVFPSTQKPESSSRPSSMPLPETEE